MTNRTGKPDTQADLELKAALGAVPSRSFIVVAGAGSGKTTSLVKALDHIVRARGTMLAEQGRKVACITYTEVAALEIALDVGHSDVVHVSTIHSFLWDLARPFHDNIGRWVLERVAEKLAEKREKLLSTTIRPNTRATLVADIERLTRDLDAIGTVRRWTYGTGSDYAGGILGHSDVLAMVPALIQQKPLLAMIVAQRFPFIFVDESQDTDPEVVAALKAIWHAHAGKFCLGFFGDPMQQIYTTGAGAVEPEVGWDRITKPENFRSATRIIQVTNAIRREGDGLSQTSGLATPGLGTARLFILPADDQRTARLNSVRELLTSEPDGAAWNDKASMRLLVIVHRMAARRLGFETLYGACHGAPAFSDAFDEGDLWILRPLQVFLLPLVAARESGREFEVITLLRKFSPLFARTAAPQEINADVLSKMNEAVNALRELLTADATTSIRDILTFAASAGLMQADDRLQGEDAALAGVLDCPAHEVRAYHQYIEGQSPYATQHGVKGAEFPRVIVVLDDEEGRYNLYSYEKLLGIRALSDTDTGNIAEGKDSVLGRTRRLFYVACSRAQEHLAVVLFVQDPARAAAVLRTANIFSTEDIHVVTA